MTAQLNRQLFTVSDYYKMAETGILANNQRYELLNGEIFKISPHKSSHTSITDFLDDEFKFYLRGIAHVRCQGSIYINEYSEPEPDIAILKNRKTRYRDRHPLPNEVLLVIEVSDSTLSKDRTVKKEMYAKAGIPQYWIVNIPDNQVEIYVNPNNGDYQKTTILKSGVLEFEGLETKVQIQIKELF